jgi:ABC-type nitrate/sulfonate/bicarbonate transport systems, periplasmic components
MILAHPARPTRKSPEVFVSFSRSSFTAIGLAALVVTACAGQTVAPSPSQGVVLTVGLGYIPSVQFAPFYLAQQAGYYAAAGLDVTFQNKIEPDLVALVGAGSIDLGIADGTDVIPAVSNAIPIQYIATLYGKFPNVVFAKESTGIKTAADLKGRKIGTPGRYGSGWIMLQALLGSAGLTTADVQIVEYPNFTQRIAVTQGVVDGATGYSNNEPVQMELDGQPATVLRIDGITPLPGPGLIAGKAALGTKQEAIAAFVAATLRAMDEIKANPTVGLDAAIVVVPELAASRDTQAAVLAATIDSWVGPVQATSGLGAIDTAGWAASVDYLTTLGLVPNPVTVDQLVRTDLLPARG